MRADVVEYLRNLLVPEGGSFVLASKGYDWTPHAENSVHGILLTEEAVLEDAFRALKPGGHLILVAPENEPTGHTGACNAEDLGFEVRDAILLLEGASGFFYEAKPSTREKEAGLFEETDAERRNVHPTVKPTSIMERLLDDIPKGEVVVDPFLGSGTTGIAALNSGHSFIGIEREPPYLEIADSRVRHWRNSRNSLRPIVIESDVTSKVTETGPISADDFFGFDE